MKTKKITVALISLSVCTVAMSMDYKAPEVGFKEKAPTVVVAKSAEFKEDYKVEGPAKFDRQIASEGETSEREPSSVVADDKKEMPVEKEVWPEDKFEPKPWLYGQKLRSNN